MLSAAAFCQELRKPASHLLALTDDPIGWGKMLWSCTADVLGRNLLHNIYFPAQGWEQKATGGEGVSSPCQAAPGLTCHLEPRRPENTQGVQRHFSVSAAVLGPGTAARLSGWGGFSGFRQRQGGSGAYALGSRCLTSQAFWLSLHKDALLRPSPRPGEGADRQWGLSAHFKHKRPTCL